MAEAFFKIKNKFINGKVVIQARLDSDSPLVLKLELRFLDEVLGVKVRGKISLRGFLGALEERC